MVNVGMAAVLLALVPKGSLAHARDRPKSTLTISRNSQEQWYHPFNKVSVISAKTPFFLQKP